MHAVPPPVFTRYLRVVSTCPMLFCALRKITSGLRGHTGFISQIIYGWAVIRLEGDIFNDLYELKLGFGHFGCD